MGPRIYLIGFMGSGKSTAGKKLAAALGYAFMDLDTMIEQKYRITIPAVFEKYDEPAFRKLERETLKQTFGLDRHVIATGGGTPCFFNNMELIREHGTSVYLKMSPGALLQRLLNSKKKRPLLEQQPRDRVLAYIDETLRAREVYYSRADHTVRGENLDIGTLKELLNEY